MQPPDHEPASYMTPPAVRTTSSKTGRRVVGFDTSPSSVLHRHQGGDDSPASARHQQQHLPEPVESPLATALKRERSLPQLPKLKLGLGKAAKGMPRSKSHGNLARQTQPAEVPAAPKPARSATNSPHAASSGGSEPVKIPFEMTRRRTTSVDLDQMARELNEEEVATTPVISAANSLLGHHLGSAAGSPTQHTAPAAAATGPQVPRSISVSKDLFVAQADAVMAHAQVQSLQTALRKEQEEVVRLREQLQLMTAERDRLLAELQQGSGEVAPVFDMDGQVHGLAQAHAAAMHQPPPSPPLQQHAAAATPAADLPLPPPPLRRPLSAGLLRGLRLR